MDKEKQEQLKESFPLTYRNLYNKDGDRCPLTERSIECGNGWYNLLYDLSEEVENILQNLDPSLCETHYVSQVKEKMGGLRFYVHGSDFPEELREFISEAETKSFKICELCGEPGKLRGGTSLMTLCDEHSGGKPLSGMIESGFYKENE